MAEKGKAFMTQQQHRDAGQQTAADGQAVSYSFGVTVEASFEEAMAQLTEALKAEGFGILTTIDVQQTMKQKLDVAFERYLILGACNPQLAYQALELEHTVGLVLPCNIVVHEAHEARGAPGVHRTRIDIADPVAMLGIMQRPAVQKLAGEARERLQRVVAQLAAPRYKTSKPNTIRA